MKYQKALHSAADMCSRQERCVSEIRKKLIKWELTEEEVETAIAYLIKEKFIDEDRFASFYVRDKFRFNGWGRIKIRWQLRQKEVNNASLEEALESLNEESYLEKLAELLYNKKRQIRNKDVWQTKAALVRFGQSRGFEPDLVYNQVDRLLNADNS
ncbi:MAG: RecX family transcriptional regulator [Marinilabiliaceae bacterium]|nr:RecX family transcriptional regulator [Marinilabiliaceae bacterium]